MVQVAICIGSNSGDRFSYMRRMEAALQVVLNAEVTCSSLMETEPVGVAPGQPWYLNRVLSGWYRKNPFMLLDECRLIEVQLGRINKGLRMERTADIDILLFGKETVATGELAIPHPAVLSRRFCLEGLYQILPDALIPGSGKTVREHHSIMPPRILSQVIRFIVPEGELHGD